MSLNTLKFNYLITLHFKGLTVMAGTKNIQFIQDVHTAYI